ncbi:hypothetical protein CHS0354_017488 [Potamilus streckersoni]|uniref:TGF-beta propeptide domain-containing protein n=1 Tax=Potamilus streckersoni TaxID=2493646 RepID=A0AAE0SYK3_9BIVA|nr:hypothetical protein CHS0354_017488 [Potamilus streckersoni]
MMPCPLLMLILSYSSVVILNIPGCNTLQDFQYPENQGITNEVEPTNITTTSSSMPITREERLKKMRQRSKDARIFYLQQHMLNTLGWEKPPNISNIMKMMLLRNIDPRYVVRRNTCYHPACVMASTDSLPQYIDRSLWFESASNSLRLFFNITLNQEPGLTITSSYLKLYVKRRENCRCFANNDDATSRFIVSVYQYTKPLRQKNRGRPRKRILDVKLVTWDGDRWVRLSVKDAIKDVVMGKRNCGFEVQVRNLNEEEMDAKKIFNPIECSINSEFDCPGRVTSAIGDLEDDDHTNKSPVLEISSTVTQSIGGLHQVYVGNDGTAGVGSDSYDPDIDQQ